MVGKVDPEERTLGGSDAAVADPRTPGLEAPPLAWPVLLLYPQYMQSDFVEACSEHTMIAELLAMVFPEEGGAERAVWDENGEYRASEMEVLLQVFPPRSASAASLSAAAAAAAAAGGGAAADASEHVMPLWLLAQSNAEHMARLFDLLAKNPSTS